MESAIFPHPRPLANSLIFSAPDAPFPNTQLGAVGKYETTEQTKGRRGTIRYMALRLNLATPPWGPSYFGGSIPNSLIFLDPKAPISQRPTGKGGEIRNYRPNKWTIRNTEERHGTLRGATERLNLDTPPWGPPHFVGFAVNSLIFLAQKRPFPNAQLGNAAKYETAELTRGRRGTARNATLRNAKGASI